MAVIDDAPGCFGLPSTVSAASPSCTACRHRKGCVDEAAKILASLPNTPVVQRERLSFAVTLKALAEVPRTVGKVLPETKTETMPKVRMSSRGIKRIAVPAEHFTGLTPRVASQTKSLMERGWFDFARTEIYARRNPADKGWKQVFCQALINGSATRRALEKEFVTQLGMTEGSAKAQVSNAISVFAAGRLITEKFDGIRLSPG